jgi:hypothetical protein
MMRIGVAPHNKIEVFNFAISHEILKLFGRRRFLGIVGQVRSANDKASLCSFLIVLCKNCN